MFDKILVAVRLSALTWTSIRYVRYLASMFGSEVYFLGLASEPQQVWDRSLSDYMENEATSLRKENIATQTAVVHGNPAVEIVKYSASNGIALIVTTNGRHGEITSTILGSIAKRMRLSLDVPVLMVPAKTPHIANGPEAVSFQRILVPLDCSATGEKALPYVIALARKTDASVLLLHVNTPPPRGVPVLHHEVVNMSGSAGKAYIRRICKNLQEQGVNADIEVVDGMAARTILKYASEKRVDLIAMGTLGLTGIESWIHSSVTNKVSERAEVPVLAVGYQGPGTEQSPV
jgi:nucleotide-binding universal stress UspA family protein